MNLYQISTRLQKFERWELFFLVFLALFGVVLSYNLAFKSILWDETPHLYGSLLLSQGRIGEYLGVTFYPPLFDAVTAGVFATFGASLFLGRFVSVIFALLTLIALYKLVLITYGRRVAFLSCFFMAATPAFIWVSRLSILESALEFFLVLCFWLFIEWLYNGDQKFALLSGLALGFAFLIKYQAIIGGLIILISLPLMLHRSEWKPKLAQLKLFIAGAGVIVVPILVGLTISGGIAPWLSLLQINDAQANIYSSRFPIPVFYIVESAFPGMQLVHPISIGIFILSALGLGLFALRRKPEDRFFLVWFMVIYVFFTLIASRTWRYVIPLYPAVAVAGAALVMALFGRVERIWKSAKTPANRKRLNKVFVACLIGISALAVAYSAYDAERWLVNESVYIPLPEATHYIAGRIGDTDALLVLCPINNLNINVLKFYLNANEGKNNTLLQYPTLPPDSYNMEFNATAVVQLCKQTNIKYAMLDENTGYKYFNSSLTSTDVTDILVSSGNFSLSETFGTTPYRVFVFEFVQY
jgi:hypothetical protein